MVSDRTQDYVISKRLLADAADALERIMLAFKVLTISWNSVLCSGLSYRHAQEVNELAGYTSRVSEMLTVFRDVKNGDYQRQLIKADSKFDIKTQVTIDSFH